MDESQGNQECVFQSRRRRECMESRLVLDAIGIPARTTHRQGEWLLWVDPRDIDAATDELEDYWKERRDQQVSKSPEVVTYGGAGIAVAVYAFVIVTIAAWDWVSALGVPWRMVGQMDAGQFLDGQYWRCITALTLHLDLSHLLSNLVFGVVFGLLAARLLGGGVGWLVIVTAGGLGNGFNAWLQEANHLSLGASTSVFAALGVIVSHAVASRNHDRETVLRRWTPLIAGVVLFSFTGIGGERTDVTAHVTGFVAGMLLGWIGFLVPSNWLDSRRIQLLAGAMALTIVVLCWVSGLALAPFQRDA